VKLRTSQEIAAIALLSPLAFVLSAYGPRIPFPPLPYLLFELWEIPVYFALYLFGFRVAFFVELVNYVATQLRPSTILFGPVYSLNAVLWTLIGAYFGLKIPFKARIVPSLLLALLLRIAGTTAFNYVFIQLPAPFGFSFPAQAFLAVLYLYVVFNAILGGYSIVLAFYLAQAVKLRLKESR